MMAEPDAIDPALPSPFIVEHDRIDREIYEYLRSELRPVRAIEQQRAIFAQVAEFLFECFALLFKETPALVVPEQRPPEAVFRGQLLEYLLGTPAFFVAFARTTLDEFASVHGALRITNELLHALRASGGIDADACGQPVPDALMAEIMAAFGRGLQRAKEERQLLDDFSQGWGTDPGHLERLPVAEKLALMEKLLKVRALREIAALAGNVVEIAQRKRGQRIPSDRGDVVGVEFGGDLANVLPSELSLLTRPRLRRLFHVRLAERRLAVIARKPRTELGRGPLVVCIDTSGSMQTLQREVWAKAVACALYTQARQDRRTFGYMHFASAYELRQVVVHRNNPGIDQLIDIATYAFGGGTDFDRPLQAALTLIRSEPELRRADIVFISDGECGVSPFVLEEIERAKHELGLSVIGVLVQENIARTAIIERWRAIRAQRAVQRHRAASATSVPSARPTSSLTIAELLNIPYVPSFVGDPIDVMLSFCDHLYPVTELTAEAAGDLVDPLLS